MDQKKRVHIRIGDIYSIAINEREKRYMQLIAYDVLQLNSDVIRCFEKVYTIEENPDIKSIIEDNILFYAHSVARLGVKLNVWTKVGSCPNVGSTDQIVFRDTNDYGTKKGEQPISVSSNWFIWKLGDSAFTRIGKLEGMYSNSHIGLVLNPFGILELARGNRYPPQYPT